MTDRLREKFLSLKCLCGHKNGWHSEVGDTCFINIYLDSASASLDGRCPCTKFVPSDNLTWVEYLAEKKGLV